MLYFIWSIINILILLFFWYLIIGFIAKGKHIFKPHFKVISVFIMVIGVIQIVAASNSEKKTNRIITTENFDKQHTTGIKKVVLEDNVTLDIKMLVEYSVEQNEFVVIESNSFLTGMVNGYEWEFISMRTNSCEPNKNVTFTADGVLKWNLFGIEIYSQAKTFRGVIKS